MPKPWRQLSCGCGAKGGLRPRLAVGGGQASTRAVARSGRAEARWLLPKICDAGSIAKDGIGAIRVREDETFVQISEGLASRFGGTVELDKGLTM